MKDKTPLSESIITGSTAAIIEAVINHPLWAIKLRSQSGKSFTLNPTILYRGLALHALSRVPATAIQMTGSRVIQEYVPLSRNTLYRDLGSGLLGGVFAATLLSPTELVMTYQHKYGNSFLHQGLNIVDKKGIYALFTGYTGTAIRLGTYTCSFFAAQPIVKEKIQVDYQASALMAHIGAAIFTGVISTFISNPADVIKTIQQDSLPEKKMSFVTAAKDTYKKIGFSGFFKGIPSRSVRVCSGVGIISYVNEVMKDNVFNKKTVG